MDFGAKRQIALVIGAQCVAMHDQDFTAIEVQSLFFGEQDHPALAGKALADEKIAVAMDEVARHAGVDDGFDCRGNLLVQRVRIVIADPCLKQIAKDIQSVCTAGFSCKKRRKPAVIAGSSVCRCKSAIKVSPRITR